MFKRIGKQIAQGAKEEILPQTEDTEDLLALAGAGLFVLGLIFFRKPAPVSHTTIIVIK